MYVTDAMPYKGQFVAVWFTDEGAPFSATMKWDGGVLKSYDSKNDSWYHEFDCEYLRDFFESNDATFYR